jgi:acyl-coenzyme A synthetase/AMP-(fatty) acid ligase
MAIHSAAPIPVPVKEKMIEWWGPCLFEYYGGTESNGFTLISSDEWLNHKGSVGRALGGNIHILGDEGEELSPGKNGLIYFQNDRKFEYHNDPLKTKASRNEKGWSTLGDIGYLDDEGYLYLTDRSTDMIISGGVNIYPQEAENVLVMHPQVVDAAVFGVPNEDFGEEVRGRIQLKDASRAGPEFERELIEFCQSQLSKMKCPVRIDFTKELPRTETGKLLRRILKKQYEGEG